MSDDNKKKELYEKQINMLTTFLKSGAVTQAQFDFSAENLKRKMGIEDDCTIESSNNGEGK